jgi:hypothetical protein
MKRLRAYESVVLGHARDPFASLVKDHGCHPNRLEMQHIWRGHRWSDESASDWFLVSGSKLKFELSGTGRPQSQPKRACQISTMNREFINSDHFWKHAYYARSLMLISERMVAELDQFNFCHGSRFALSSFLFGRWRQLVRGQHTAESSRKSIHRAHRIIGGHVYGRVVFAGGFFQHVCGNSDPVRAL